MSWKQAEIICYGYRLPEITPKCTRNLKFPNFTRVGAWQFSTAAGELLLDAVCNGALYAWGFELDPRCDEPGFFEARLAEAKKAIKTVMKNQKLKQQSSAIQLSLF